MENTYTLEHVSILNSGAVGPKSRMWHNGPSDPPVTTGWALRVLCWIGLGPAYQRELFIFDFFCRIGATDSPGASLTCGIPQGFILELLLFSLLVFALGSKMENRASSPIFLQVIDKFMSHQRFECIEEIKDWMSSIFFVFKISFNSRVIAVWNTG